MTVEKGFLSDGVSVLGNNERTRKYLEASIVHDYLYVAWQFLARIIRVWSDFVVADVA